MKLLSAFILLTFISLFFLPEGRVQNGFTGIFVAFLGFSSQFYPGKSKLLAVTNGLLVSAVVAHWVFTPALVGIIGLVLALAGFVKG
jgi:hypothetical protein